MKHPILFRTVFYGCLVGLSATIMFLLHHMNEAPFKSSDMRSAFYNGCNFGGPRPLTEEHVYKCSNAASLYKQYLDELDRQMEERYEEMQ